MYIEYIYIYVNICILKTPVNLYLRLEFVYLSCNLDVSFSSMVITSPLMIS